MTHEKVVGKTPAGGDYSEIYYFDAAGNPAEADAAVRCVIRECKADGTLIAETFGTCSGVNYVG